MRKQLNPREFIKENIDVLGDGFYYECEGLIERIMKVRFEKETGFYFGRFDYFDDYEEQKKIIMKKIEKIGLTPKIYKRYKEVEYLLCKRFCILENCTPQTQKIFGKESDKNYLKIIYMDNFIPHDPFDPIKKRDEMLMKYFEDNGIETKEIKLTKTIMKVKKTSKEHAKIKKFIDEHNQMIEIMWQYEKFQML